MSLLLLFAPATLSNVSISQVGATITLTGGTQAVATVNDVAITQSAATITLAGGTQLVKTNGIVSQSAATITLTGGTQIISINTGPLPPHKLPNPIFLLDGRIALRVGGNIYMPL